MGPKHVTPHRVTTAPLTACVTAGSPLSEDEMQANVAVFLVGGYETTATTVLWFLHALATHPDVADRLEQELVASGLVRGDGAPGA